MLPSKRFFSRMRTGSFNLISFFFRPILFSLFSDVYICFLIGNQQYNCYCKGIAKRDKKGTKSVK
ncbi:MAG TPA: hypothetical protein DD464_10595 [Bacteroides sp.]|nr:hypothetical protein [Bacteroides sp.]